MTITMPGAVMARDAAMRWNKRGRIYVPDGSESWAHAYGFPPTPVQREDGTLRLYMAFCDQNTVGRVGFVDVDPDDPARVIRVSREPVLDIGQPGAFDENGVLPTCVLPVGDELYMYYVGYQLGQQLRYYQFLGLAISADGGDSFERVKRVPVIDRTDAELVNRTSGFVMRDGERFKLWYVGGSEWTVGHDGKDLPVYEMKYLESDNGIDWGPEGETAIPLDTPDEHALGRPWVVHLRDGGYRMFYSTRRISNGYRIGFADSDDGRNWKRRDREIGIDVSDDGWDSEMLAYASVVTLGDRTYMFYNGNGCGRTGFGYAELDRAD